MSSLRSVENIKVFDPVDAGVLNWSADDFRKHHQSTSGRPPDKVLVGAATFQRPSGSGQAGKPAILLLKRAADERYLPHVFEIPSGKADPDDPTLKHALAREVKEETGLDMTGICQELKPMMYTTEKTIKNELGNEVLISRSAIQLNYVVSVAPGPVKLNPKEHSESRWVTETDLDGLNITDAMKAVVEESFSRVSDQ